MKCVPILLSIALFGLAGCNANPTPDQIRQDTAKATKTAAQDAKAVAQGVSDAFKKNDAVNINAASADDLEKLPGIDAARARRIIANRPYDHSDDLVKKHAISKDEYDRISSQVVAK